MKFQIASIILGLWVLISPALLPATPEGATVDRIAGPVIILVGGLALRSVTRPFRLLNVLSGLFLVIATWLVPNTGALTLSSALVGVAVIGLALIEGGREQRTDGGWWAVVRP